MGTSAAGGFRGAGSDTILSDRAPDMHKTLVILVVGLTRRLLGPDTPHLGALAARGGLRTLDTVVPAVTCTAQSTLLTGLPPSGHGAVANGWYYRDTAEVCALEAVEPADRRREGVGGRQATRSRLHLRQHVLVVQYVFDRRHQRDATTDVSRRWPQASRSLRRAAGTARRAQRASRHISLVHVLGAGNVRRIRAAGSPARRRTCARHGRRR